MFNLIPTDPLEYKIYADWLEDRGVILTASIRMGILPFFTPENGGEAAGREEAVICTGKSLGGGVGNDYGAGHGWASGAWRPRYTATRVDASGCRS